MSPSNPAELDPHFDAFYLETQAPTTPEAIVALAAERLGGTWTATPVEEASQAFDLESEDVDYTAGEAWAAAYRLEADAAISYAEPLFEVAVYEDAERLRPPSEDEGGVFEAAESVEEHLDGSKDAHWGLTMINAQRAWKEFFNDDPEKAGTGIIVGHPDTGYRLHPEVKDQLLVAQGFDFVENDHDAQDDLKKSLKVVIDNLSHGLSTSSVIISRSGSQQVYGPEPVNGDYDPDGKAVTGVAPGARLIPIRTSRTVVLLNMRRLAKAIDFAVRRGAHVISISMGGVWNLRLRRAVRRAEDAGVIVCAAAGNKVRVTVWPANFREVVAVAACNVEKGPWSGSSRGRVVNVTAPGESVWRARDITGDNGVTSHVGRGSGTSYAVAHVAGVAALWLAHHGRDALIARYGKARLPDIFRSMLADSASQNHNLPDEGFGAGIVDAYRLLSLPLPDGPSPFEMAEVLPVPATVETPMEQFEAIFDVYPSEDPFEAAGDDGHTRLADTIGRVLAVPSTVLPERLARVGRELAFNLMVDDEVHRAFVDTMNQPAPDVFEMSEGSDPLDEVRSMLQRQSLSESLRTSL